jgi:membrane protease YdiL (CAAX protease family)
MEMRRQIRSSACLLKVSFLPGLTVDVSVQKISSATRLNTKGLPLMPGQQPYLHSLSTASQGDCRTRKVVAFYLLSLALSWPAMFLWRLPDSFQVGDVTAARDAYGRVGLFFGFGPALAALVVAFAFNRGTGLRELASRIANVRISPIWYLAALALPILPQWLGVTIWSTMSGETLRLPGFTEWLVRWLQLALLHGVFSVGEELGWRGYLLPYVLVERGWFPASLLVGAAWAVWHYPLWFAANLAATGSVPQTAAILLLASLSGVALSVMITWIFVNTRGSLVPSLLFHGSVNANMNIIFEGINERAVTQLDLLASISAATVMLAAIIVIFASQLQCGNR